MAKQTEKLKESNQDPLAELPKIDECFIITPIGDFGSETFSKANGLIDSVINPVLEEFNFKGTAAHQINKSGSINNQIIKRILEDKLCIVNLTGLNPNVMYELAIRHAARLPVIIMAEKALTPKLPFDITDQRTIFYSDSLSGNVVAKQQLREMIKIALEDEKPDNPIYTAASQDKIFQTLDDDSPLKLIMERLDKIDSRSRQSDSISEDTIWNPKAKLKGLFELKLSQESDALRSKRATEMYEKLKQFDPSINRIVFKDNHILSAVLNLPNFTVFDNVVTSLKMIKDTTIYTATIIEG